MPRLIQNESPNFIDLIAHLFEKISHSESATMNRKESKVNPIFENLS